MSKNKRNSLSPSQLLASSSIASSVSSSTNERIAALFTAAMLCLCFQVLHLLQLSADEHLYFVPAAMVTDQMSQNLVPFVRYEMSDL